MHPTLDIQTYYLSYTTTMYPSLEIVPQKAPDAVVGAWSNNVIAIDTATYQFLRKCKVRAFASPSSSSTVLEGHPPTMSQGQDAAEQNIQMWKVKKLIKSLDSARGCVRRVRDVRAGR